MTEKTRLTVTHTKTTHTTLDPLEEKVVRMRHGLTAPGDLPLEFHGDDNDALAMELSLIRQRAVAAVGARESDTKRKIVQALRRRHRNTSR